MSVTKVPPVVGMGFGLGDDDDEEGATISRYCSTCSKFDGLKFGIR